MNYQPLVWLGIPLLCYAIQSFAVYYAAHRYGMALTMFAYAIANVGMILDAYGV